MVEGLGCKALRVTDPEKIERRPAPRADAWPAATACRWSSRCILERVTNIAMGTEIDKVNEFEAIDCRHPEGTEGLALAGLLD